MVVSSLKFVGNTPIYQLDNTNIFVKLEKYNLGEALKIVLFLVCWKKQNVKEK